MTRLRWSRARSTTLALAGTSLLLVLTGCSASTGQHAAAASKGGTSSSHPDTPRAPQSTSDANALCRWVMDDSAVRDVARVSGGDTSAQPEGTVAATGDRGVFCRIPAFTVAVAESSDPKFLTDLAEDPSVGKTPAVLGGLPGRFSFASGGGTVRMVGATFGGIRGDRAVVIAYNGAGDSIEAAVTEAMVRNAFSVLVKRALDVALPKSHPAS